MQKGFNKMAKISKANLYAILWLDSQNKTTNEIAKELSISEPQILKALEKHKKTTEATTTTNNVNTAKAPVSRSQSLMIRETAGKKINSVAIMTGEASMANDALKNQAQPKTKNTDKYIFRPKN